MAARVKPTGSVSLWILIACAVLYLLQLPPIPGVILMIFGAALIEGVLIDLFFVSVFLEAISGRIPRWMIVVPVVACGGYYTYYFQQNALAEAEARRLKLGNPAKLIDFDPAKDSLVTPDANEIASRYTIPVAYQPDFRADRPNAPGYRSYRMLARPQCTEAATALQNLMDARVYGVAWLTNVVLNHVPPRAACILQIPEKPTGSPIVVTRQKNREDGRAITVTTTTFSRDGKDLATFKTAIAERLPPIPFVVAGCALDSGAPAWRCVTTLWRSYATLDTLPDGVDKTRFDSPESVVLGLRKYDPADYAKLPFNADISDQLRVLDDVPHVMAAEKAQTDQQMIAQFLRFAQSEEIVTYGKGIFTKVTFEGLGKPPEPMRNVVERSTATLVPHRAEITRRYAQLLDAKIFVRDSWLALLSQALAAMPRDAFAQMSDGELSSLLQAMSKAQIWRYDLDLYQRTADAGPRTQSFFEHDVERFSGTPSGLEPAILAICRLGQASADTRAAIERAFAKSNASASWRGDMILTSDAFVTLTKLGETTFLDQNPVRFTDPEVMAWFAAVKEGRGRTPIGPDNCAGWENKAMRSFRKPAPLTPGLVFEGDQWVAATH